LKQAVAAVLLVSTLLVAPANARDTAAAESAVAWPEWERFAERFIQADGRVIDLTFDGKSTSEGQSYGLFFALVANRRAQFDTLLHWTSDNLADGQLGQRLPGWLWGKRDDGSWGIKDRNAATDADLWLAYTLLEAGRLWNSPQYSELGKQLLALVRKHEVVQAGAAGTLLLPGPIGFELPDGRYRVNPSYLPGFLFNYLDSADPDGPWAAVWTSYMKLAPRLYAHGVAPDNFIVNARGVVSPDTQGEPSGSYDAIRVYLWAGMSGQQSADLVRLLQPYGRLTRKLGTPPEKVNPASGAATKTDYSPIGFSGALLPFASALNDKELLAAQLERVQADAVRARLGGATNYYDQALILFGKGWQDGVYRFDEQGRLVTRWK